MPLRAAWAGLTLWSIKGKKETTEKNVEKGGFKAIPQNASEYKASFLNMYVTCREWE